MGQGASLIRMVNRACCKKKKLNICTAVQGYHKLGTPSGFQAKNKEQRANQNSLPTDIFIPHLKEPPEEFIVDGVTDGRFSQPHRVIRFTKWVRNCLGAKQNVASLAEWEGATQKKLWVSRITEISLGETYYEIYYNVYSTHVA